MHLPRYTLRTLMFASGIVPPAIAFLWFHWRELLILTAIAAVFSLWGWISYSIAYFFGWLVASTME